MLLSTEYLPLYLWLLLHFPQNTKLTKIIKTFKKRNSPINVSKERNWQYIYLIEFYYIDNPGTESSCCKGFCMKIIWVEIWIFQEMFLDDFQTILRNASLSWLIKVCKKSSAWEKFQYINPFPFQITRRFLLLSPQTQNWNPALGYCFGNVVQNKNIISPKSWTY